MQPQYIMPVQDRLQGGGQVRLGQVLGNPQQHGLAESPSRSIAVQEPADDRGREDLADRRVRVPRERKDFHGRSGRCGQGLDRRILEHIPRCYFQTSATGPAHQQHQQDAVAAQLEEVVLHAHPLQAQHLGPDVGQEFLGGGARAT